MKKYRNIAQSILIITIITIIIIVITVKLTER